MKNNLPKKLLLSEIERIKKTITLVKKNYLKNFDKLCFECLKTINKNNKIIFYGNGGSASDAQHLAAELVVRYKKNRKPISAISLATDTSIITATGNDFNFKFIFSRQIEAIAKRGDLAIAITTSGNSQNLIEAAKTLNKMKIKSFCLSGNGGGRLKKFIKYPVIIPSKNTSEVQVIEIMIGQILCEFLENNINLKKIFY
jgi:D-sedoheptulose 7-phosphate isomerase